MAQPSPQIYRPDPPTWFNPLANHSNGKRVPGPKLDLEETKAAGQDFVAALVVQPAVRHAYYTLSRTWHDAYKPGANPKDLEFGEQLCMIFEGTLGMASGELGLVDAANLHKFAFQTLRRAVYSLTSHEIDKDSDSDGDTGGVVQVDGLENEFSWHWPPNGFPGSGNVPSFDVIQLGFDPANP